MRIGTHTSFRPTGLARLFLEFRTQNPTPSRKKSLIYPPFRGCCRPSQDNMFYAGGLAVVRAIRIVNDQHSAVQHRKTRMNTHRKDKMDRIHPALRWILRIGMFIAAAMILFLSITAWLIDTQSVKQMIVKEIRQKAGVQMTVQEVRLSVLPRPHVTLAGGNVSIPGRAEINWGALSVYPRLLPLFVGHIQIGRMAVQRPDATITVPGKTEQPGDRQHPPLIAAMMGEAFAPMVASLSAMGEEMEGTIAGGRVTVTLQDKTVIHLTDIDVHIDSSATILSIDLQSRAEFCETIAVKTSIDPRSLKSQGQINLVQLRTHRLPAQWIPAGAVRAGSEPVDLGLTFHVDKADGFQAEVRSTLPMVTVQRGKNQLEIKGQTLAGRFHQDHQGTTVELSELQLDDPQVTLGGTFFSDRNGSGMKVELTGREVDVASIRRAALKLAGDITEVTDTFDIVKGGRLPTFRLTTRGNSFGDMGTLEHMTLTASLLQGEVSVPGVNVAATDVSAEVTLANGMLEASRISARYGNTRVTDGAMRLGLSGDNPPFHLDIGMTADLRQVPPILKQVVSNKRFLKEMDRLGDIGGQARGRLILGDRLETIETTVRVSEFNLSARAVEFAYRLELDGRDFSYSDASVAARHLNGRIHRSDSSRADTAVTRQQGAQWLATFFNLPPMVALRPPLAISDGRFSWDRDGRTAYSGTLTLDDDLELSADVIVAPDELDIRKLAVKDTFSQASVVFNHRVNNDIVFGFNGNLEKTTLQRLLAGGLPVPGSISGGLHGEYVNDQPLKSNVKGRLNARDLDLSGHMGVPVRVRHLSIEGVKDILHLESDMLVQQDHQVTLKGDLNHSPKGLRVDADLYSTGIALDSLAKAFGANKQSDDGVPKKRFWEFPVTGVLRLDADVVTYGPFTWRPLAATVTLTPEKIEVVATDAALCGISTPGTVTFTPDAARLKVTPVAHHQDLDSSVPCLWDKTAKVLGTFDLSGEIEAQGHPRDLPASLAGNIAFSAAKGTIYAGRTFRNIINVLTFLNITEIFRGRIPELKEDGFAFNSITAKLRIKTDSIVLEEGVIDAPSLSAVYNGEIRLADKTLDIAALVAPLKFVDTLVRHTPIVNQIADAIDTVPISLKGDLDDPDIGFLPPAAAAKGLVGIMERTLELPVKMIEKAGSF